ncbi:ribonuclease M5 [Bombilactobacillus mellifer]|uniref:ribonuclease M5 n=1 Tax=Bombilactobacillus mellifer TaxID=1218492 RepID=UPI0023F3E07B|nr:ribonuclease M5 [Bombilactobacillus mellifer]MCT6826300.1 ribonuclease M5 [Bombilactobacillus mellifer]
MTKIKEVIVVEGRDDTARLHQVLGAVDTIETHGSAIDANTLALIKKAQSQRGVIVLTDPDFNGDRIRRIIVQQVPGVKQAFLRRQDAVPPHHHGSLGLEHASAAVIQQALQAVWTPQKSESTRLLTQSELVELGLSGHPQARQLREQIGDLLHIGYANAKQLPQRLQMFGISLAQVQAAVAQVRKGKHGS